MISLSLARVRCTVCTFIIPHIFEVFCAYFRVLSMFAHIFPKLIWCTAHPQYHGTYGVPTVQKYPHINMMVFGVLRIYFG